MTNRKSTFTNNVKQFILILLCFVVCLGAFPSTISAKASRTEAVGSKGYTFNYKDIEFDNIAFANETIFTASSADYEYECCVTSISSTQSNMTITRIKKSATIPAPKYITACYFSDGLSYLVSNEFKLEEATITAIYNYGIFNLAFSNGEEDVFKIIAFDETNVLDDLISAGVDLSEYPYDSTGSLKTPGIINFVEFGYSADPEKQSQFGLYVYFYNPQNVAIEPENLSNRIQLACAYSGYSVPADSTPTSYDTYELKFCSMSTGAYSGLFYKFRIIDHKGEDGKTIQQRVYPAERRYDVSGIVLYNKVDGGKEYTVGGSYRFSGFAEGFGYGAAEGGTLTSTSFRSLETIRLEVMLTTYVSDTVKRSWWNDHTIEGYKIYDSLHSAYFSIPNKYLMDKDGNLTGSLQKAHIEWWEYKTQPILITKDQYYYDWQDSPGKHAIVDIGRVYDGVYLKYLVPEDKFTSHGAVLVKGETLLNDTLSYNATANKGYLPIKNGNISADLFLDTVDEGRTRGYNNISIDANDKYNLLTTDSAWYIKYFSGLPSGEDIKIERAISPISEDELNIDLSEDGQLEAFSNSLYISSNDAVEIQSKAENALNQDETPYLLRFATTEVHYGEINEPGFLDLTYSLRGYYVCETAFFDFKFIDLTFEVDGEYYTVPAVQDPIDYFPDIESRFEYIGEKGPPWWTLIIAIVAGFILALALILELIIIGKCFTKKAGIVLIILGIVFLVGFGILDFLFVDWVHELLRGYGGVWLP